jgi:methyltransferase (TIGR00027 family)
MIEERQGSKTALGVAWLRAAHQVIDSPPLILEDPAIVDLFGRAPVEHLRTNAGALQTPGARALRSHVVLRSRYVEDRLKLAEGRGTHQYVILGAGYDTFILRQPEWASALRIYEVDHPSTQMEKRARISRAGRTVPPNASFVGIDFEQESLKEGLVRHDVRFDAQTFFSWLGVTMYLTEPAVDAVLRTVLEFPKGSEIAFTFASPPAPGQESATRLLAERVAAMGEPWITYFEPEALDRKLRTLGFAQVEFLEPAESAARYFTDRADKLPAPTRKTIVSATV